MANLIEAVNIPGASVYGVPQMSYTVDGVAGKDYAAARAAAAFKEATSIETALAGYAEVVRQRQRKLEDLGAAMAGLNYAYATLKVKDMESGDKTDYSSQLYNAYVLAGKYGISIGWTGYSNYTMQSTRKQIMNAQNAVQYAIDREDNDLKQDMVSLNSYITKRDNSFSTASKLVKKANNAASSTIGNIGG